MSFVQPSFPTDGSIGWNFEIRQNFCRGTNAYVDLPIADREKLYTALREAAVAGKWRRSHNWGYNKVWFITMKRFNQRWVYLTYEKDGLVVETVYPATPCYVKDLSLETPSHPRKD